jgi:hypothetical protein
VDGDYRDPDEESVEAWLFNDAPRWMRIEAIGRIPDLLEWLLRQTQETTRSIQKKTAQASEIVQAINEVAESSQFEDLK